MAGKEENSEKEGCCGEGCSCCSKRRCCSGKAALVLVLLLIGGLFGYGAGRCHNMHGCPSKMGDCPMSAMSAHEAPVKK